MGRYLRPRNLDEALAALQAKPSVVLAGGTDFYPARVGRPLSDDVLDITALAALKRIERDGRGWRIGALVSWTDLIRAPLPSTFDGLKQAAREVGGVQIQNAGTLCGNICNASPAADSVPVLLALDATVELASARARRELPLAEFILGNRKTALRPDELVIAILVPSCVDGTRSRFLKLGTRKYLVISIVMVAAVIEPSSTGKIAAARLAVGACSATAQRLPVLEAALVGRPIDGELGRVVEPSHIAPLQPIDDIRATADYRRDASLTLLRRILSELGGGA